MSELYPGGDLDDLYENAPCGYLTLAPDGTVTRVNATLCGWLRKSSGQILGQLFRNLLNIAGTIFYETHFSPLLHMQGFINEVALDLSLGGGKVLPVLANASERRDMQGNTVYTRVTIFRASERRRYERELVESRATERETRSKLQELVASLKVDMAEQIAKSLADRETSEFREQFIAVLGHDLRNPVASIEAGIKMLGRDGQSEKSERVLRLMQSSVIRMNGLIDNVLDLARSRLGGGISLTLEPNHQLAQTLENVIDELRSAHADREIISSIDVPQTVAVDPQRIGQMLSNLLGNAVSHGATNAPISISGGLNETGAFQLSVANGGDAIRADMMEHLFKPFHRGEVRNNAEGLGLGLYIASQIAEAHGGKIAVSSNDQETRFTFSMPA